MRYQDAVTHLEKRAGALNAFGNFLRNIPRTQTYQQAANAGKSFTQSAKGLGQSAYNMAFGGRTHAGKWEPFHAFDRIGRTQQTYASGPLKGNRMFRGNTDAPVLSKDRDWLGYLRQEWEGGRPTRADFAASMMRKNAPKDAWTNPNNMERGFFGGIKAPTGVPAGEFQKRILQDHRYAQQRDMLENMNKMSVGDFIKNHPGVAARYYGTNALQKGFLAGLPAYEVYDAVANNSGALPEEGVGANLGRTLGSGAGALMSMPFGLVGGGLAMETAGQLGRKAGSWIDKMRGAKPLQQLQEERLARMAPQQAARDLEYGLQPYAQQGLPYYG